VSKSRIWSVTKILFRARAFFWLKEDVSESKQVHFCVSKRLLIIVQEKRVLFFSLETRRSRSREEKKGLNQSAHTLTREKDIKREREREK